MTNSIKYADRRYTARGHSEESHIVTGDAMAVKAQLFQARQAGMTDTSRIFQIGTVNYEQPRALWLSLTEDELNEAARRCEAERYHGAVYTD